jgi:hypothetical protein
MNFHNHQLNRVSSVTLISKLYSVSMTCFLSVIVISYIVINVVYVCSLRSDTVPRLLCVTRSNLEALGNLRLILE